MIILHTNHGDITIELDSEKAPKTVENFLDYVNSDFYKDTIFHRVIDGFMIQGGGFTKEMSQKDSKDPIENEASNKLSNKKGTISMARTMDPHSASSQFFINVADNDFLDFQDESTQGWGYCVFGKVTDGLDVIDKIAKVDTTTKNGHENVPTEEIVIEQVEVVEG